MEILIIEHFVRAHSSWGCAFSLLHRHSLLDWRAPDCSENKRWNHSTVKRFLSPRCGVITAETFVRTSFHHFDYFHHWSWFSDQTLQTERYIFLNTQKPRTLHDSAYSELLSQNLAPAHQLERKIIYFEKFETFLLLLLLCLRRKGANNNWNNIFHILYSISTYNR